MPARSENVTARAVYSEDISSDSGQLRPVPRARCEVSSSNVEVGEHNEDRVHSDARVSSVFV